MGPDSRTSCHDMANDTGASASSSACQNPQRTQWENTRLGADWGGRVEKRYPAVLPLPATSHLTPSPCPTSVLCQT